MFAFLDFINIQITHYSPSGSSYMYLGALVAGPLVDILTVYYNEKEEEEGSDEGGDSSSSWVMTNNRAIILSGIVANFIAVFVAFSVREIKVDAATNNSKREESCTDLVSTDSSSISSHDNDNEEGPLNGGKNSGNNNNKAPGISTFQPIKGSSYQILSETIRTPRFHRFLLVCLLTINVRMVFRHL